ncbi:MAG: hypothetical protein Cons2KO_28000 [Congregibacter sp.]
MHPVALELAMSGSREQRVVYLARPCQYESRRAPACESSVWTHRRYSLENLQLMNAALDSLKQDADQLLLYGYSGGGVMAALLAATRDDVLGFVTMAANLDTQAWTIYHAVSPLLGSMNPVDFAGELAGVPQVHFVGGKDETVPRQVVASYFEHLGISKTGRWVLKPDFDHGCCWSSAWPALYGEAMSLLEQQIIAFGETNR